MCDKGVSTHSSTIQFIPECYKTQELCYKVISDDPFSIRYAPDQYKA